MVYQRMIKSTKSKAVVRSLVTQSARRTLIRVQNGHCPYCSVSLDYVASSIDHVWPMALGGFDGMGNWIACHRRCNERKKHRLPTVCELLYLFHVNEILGVPTKTKGN